MVDGAPQLLKAAQAFAAVAARRCEEQKAWETRSMALLTQLTNLAVTLPTHLAQWVAAVTGQVSEVVLARAGGSFASLPDDALAALADFAATQAMGPGTSLLDWFLTGEKAASSAASRAVSTRTEASSSQAARSVKATEAQSRVKATSAPKGPKRQGPLFHEVPASFPGAASVRGIVLALQLEWARHTGSDRLGGALRSSSFTELWGASMQTCAVLVVQLHQAVSDCSSSTSSTAGPNAVGGSTSHSDRQAAGGNNGSEAGQQGSEQGPTSGMPPQNPLNLSPGAASAGPAGISRCAGHRCGSRPLGCGLQDLVDALRGMAGSNEN